MYIDAAYCYRQSSMVCRSVTIMSPANIAEPIEMLLGLWGCGLWWAKGTMCSMGVEILSCEWEILMGKGSADCKVYGLFDASCAKNDIGRGSMSK